MFRLWSLRGQFSCPGKKIDKKPAQGALPKSRPLENPPAASPELRRYISGCYWLFYRKILKNMLSLRASPQTGVAIRPLVPLGSHSGGAVTKWLRRQKAPSPPPAPLPKGEARPSSVSRLRETHEPPSPEGKVAREADCDRRESPEGATPVLRHWFAMTTSISVRHCQKSFNYP